MTAIGFLMLIAAFALLGIDKPSTATNAAITLCLVGGVIFLVGGIFRWLWQVMP